LLKVPTHTVTVSDEARTRTLHVTGRYRPPCHVVYRYALYVYLYTTKYSITITLYTVAVLDGLLHIIEKLHPIVGLYVTSSEFFSPIHSHSLYNQPKHS